MQPLNAIVTLDNFDNFYALSQCLKITGKVSFKNHKVCDQTLLPDRSILKRQKIGGKGQRPN